MRRRYSAVPWAEVGNGCVASATCVLAYAGAGLGVAASAGIGAMAYAGYRLAFGTDATLDELFAGAPGFDAAAAGRLLSDAGASLDRARAAALAIAGSSQEAQLLAFVASGGRVLEAVEREPARLPRAQRFLDLYLDGVASAAERYAALRARGEGEAVRDQFAALLSDAVETGRRQERALAEDDERGLDVDMTVLRRRMALEAPGASAAPRPDQEGRGT